MISCDFIRNTWHQQEALLFSTRFQPKCCTHVSGCGKISWRFRQSLGSPAGLPLYTDRHLLVLMNTPHTNSPSSHGYRAYRWADTQMCFKMILRHLPRCNFKSGWPWGRWTQGNAVKKCCKASCAKQPQDFPAFTHFPSLYKNWWKFCISYAKSAGTRSCHKTEPMLSILCQVTTVAASFSFLGTRYSSGT